MGTWDEKFVVGIKMVDEQHQQLVEKVDELHAAMRAGEGQAKLGPLMKFLGEYAVKHFSTEEAIMKLYKYPKFEEHKKIHEDFKADFGKLSQELASAAKTSLLSIQVERRLFDWLVQHIKVKDREAAAFMTAKGAK